MYPSNMRPTLVLAILLTIAACHRRPAEDASSPTPIEPSAAKSTREKPAPNPRELAAIAMDGAADVTSLVVRDKKAFWVEHDPSGYGADGSRAQRGQLRVTSSLPEPRAPNEAIPLGKSIAT